MADAQLVEELGIRVDERDPGTIPLLASVGRPFERHPHDGGPKPEGPFVIGDCDSNYLIEAQRLRHEHLGTGA